MAFAETQVAVPDAKHERAGRVLAAYRGAVSYRGDPRVDAYIDALPDW